jgi:hypothetical protein
MRWPPIIDGGLQWPNSNRPTTVAAVIAKALMAAIVLVSVVAPITIAIIAIATTGFPEIVPILSIIMGPIIATITAVAISI